MTDRENSPAYAALPRSARRVFAAIERAIGDGVPAALGQKSGRNSQNMESVFWRTIAISVA